MSKNTRAATSVSPFAGKAATSAQANAERCQAYWHEQGFTDVRIWVERRDGAKANTGPASDLWITCSNLVDGLPPSWAQRRGQRRQAAQGWHR